MKCCRIYTVLHTSRLCFHPSHQGSGSGSSSEMFRLLQAKNVARPQLKFKEKVDNSNTPFIPKIFIKPNALKPLPSCRTYVHPYVPPIFCFPSHLVKEFPLHLQISPTNKSAKRDRRTWTSRQPWLTSSISREHRSMLKTCTAPPVCDINI